MSKSDFKMFARNRPELANYVSSGTTTWQSLYELYEIYGDKSTIWNDYTPTNETRAISLNSPIEAKTETLNASSEASLTNNTTNKTTKANGTNPASITDVINMVKKIDLETVQKGVTNLQKTIGLLQDLGVGGAAGAVASNLPKSYESRPIYKYFED